ncbi:MAG: SGNH/GDSL hydrolase family protein [Candidatus Electryonea clarkiae]|nr:SGNH/GDSL hydrolase family protein [Candidatus Electryonea clarkiae]MDP8286289.1 SGNH/GDSL hydrolase family protein [Candidatus Electryonea clarkiae]
MKEKKSTEKKNNSSRTVFLVRISGFILLAGALFFNEYTAELLSYSPGLHSDTIMKVRITEFFLFATATASFLFAGLAKRHPHFNRILSLRHSTNIALLFTAFIIPAGTVELGLRAFLITDSVFQGDTALGWKLKPDVEGFWNGTKIETNKTGFRGSEIPYERSKDKLRLLFLGDSVPFGYRMQNYQQTFPVKTQKILEKETGFNFEIVNLSVPGYSPRQENIVLRNEGKKYTPDIVILSIILNDFTDKLLTRNSMADPFKKQNRGLIPALIMNLSRISGIFHYLKAATIRDKLVIDTEEALLQRKGYIETLINDRDKKHVQVAWQKTMDNIVDISRYCRMNDMPLLLLIFPYSMQLNEPYESITPQDIIARFTGKHGIHALDLLPLFRERIENDNIDVQSIFMDFCHPTATGCEMTAEFLASFIMKEQYSFITAKTESNFDPGNLSSSDINQ